MVPHGVSHDVCRACHRLPSRVCSSHTSRPPAHGARAARPPRRCALGPAGLVRPRPCVAAAVASRSHPAHRAWDEAVHALIDEYMEAFEDRQHTFTLLAALYFPLWCAITICIAIIFFVFSQLRSFCGGSVRLFFKKSAEDVLIKVQSMQRLPSFDALDQAEKKSPEKQI